MLARVSVAIVALLACAWFVLGARQSKNLEHATAIVQSHAKLTAAQAARARSLLNGAARLNPDQEPDIVRARVALEVGDHPGALKILSTVTRNEPKNVEGWLWTTRGSTDRKTYFTGLAHIGLLEPNVQ